MQIQQRNVTQISIFSYRVTFHYINMKYIGGIEHNVLNPTIFRFFTVLMQLDFNIILYYIILYYAKNSHKAWEVF